MTVRKLIFWAIFLQECYGAPTPQLKSVSLIISVKDVISILMKTNPSSFMDANVSEFLDSFLNSKHPNWLRKKIDKCGDIFLKTSGKNVLKLQLPIMVFGENDAFIEHTCRCNYMNEADNFTILPTNWKANLDFLDAWKFSKVASFINISKLDNFTWMDNLTREIFE
jgi:hypothetical protein